ncbi:hypothetical protein TNCV_2859521 [Trichonephila clavipes]|nr:hypothetical protein TNCV_2859521 [Trichonephila clavipes]
MSRSGAQSEARPHSVQVPKPACYSFIDPLQNLVLATPLCSVIKGNAALCGIPDSPGRNWVTLSKSLEEALATRTIQEDFSERLEVEHGRRNKRGIQNLFVEYNAKLIPEHLILFSY